MAIDPQKAIIQAVKEALNGLTLPVKVTIPQGMDEYVLISQPTLTPGRSIAACKSWNATLMLSVFTKFKRGMADTEPALDVSAEIMERLVDQRLNLGEFSMSPLELQRLSLPQKFDDKNVYVQDNLRLRFEVYAEATVIVPANKPLADYTPAEILASYPRLAELGPLNCPVVSNTVDLVASFTAATGDTCVIPIAAAQAVLYTGYHITGGAVEAVWSTSTGDYYLDATDQFVLRVGDTITVTRKEGNPTITFLGA